MYLLWQPEETKTWPQLPQASQAGENRSLPQNPLLAPHCLRSSPSPLAGPPSPPFSFILASSLTISPHSQSPHQPSSHRRPPAVTISKCSFPSQVSTPLLGLFIYLEYTPSSRPLLSLTIILQVSEPCKSHSPLFLPHPLIFRAPVTC